MSNPEEFCDDVEDIVGSDGLRASEACCICSGGFRPNFGEKEDANATSSPPAPTPSATTRQQARRLQEGQPPFAEDPPEPTPKVDVRDWTTRSGLGESPGIPNLEYLGLGYDGIRGNPRGSFSSEMDPGFRFRIFSLLQDQSILSVDQEYTIPLGTDFKYTSSCRYDSVSEEISSESDYSSSLSREADMSSASSSSSSSTETKSNSWSAGFSITFPIKGLFGSVGSNAEGGSSETTSRSDSNSKAFKGSERFSSFSSVSRSESTVSFEAKAICSEFEIMFNQYDKKTLDPRFQKALGALPVPYDDKNLEHKRIYAKFISAYGTHYTTKVVLGAKRILTTSMSSQTVAELTRESVDISGTLSVKMQEAISTTKSERFGISAAASLSKTPDAVNVPELGETGGSGSGQLSNGELTINLNIKGGDDEKNGSSSSQLSNGELTINLNIKGGDDAKEGKEKEKEPTLFNINGKNENSSESSSSKESSTEFSNFSRNKRESEAASKISSKNIKTTEVNIGGLPNSDWRQWAASVKDKPMPISYELVGLWNLMSDTKAHAFYQAFKDIEGIDLSSTDPNPLLDEMNFGVYAGSGEPLSSYSSNSNADYRALLQVDSIPSKVKPKVDVIKLFEPSDSFPSAPIQPELPNSLACGIEVNRETRTDQELLGRIVDLDFFVELKMEFCEIEDWTKKIKKTIHRIKEGIDTETGTCPSGTYIDGMRVRFCGPGGEGERGKRCIRLIDGSVLGEYSPFQPGLIGLEISCNSLSGGPDERTTRRIFCLESSYEINEGQQMFSDCKNDAQWDPWIYLPKSNDVNAPNGIYGANAYTGRIIDNEAVSQSEIVNIQLFYRQTRIPGTGFENNVVTYAATWKGKEKRPSAIFATAIHGSEGSDEDEESKFGIDNIYKNGRNVGILNNVPFAITDNLSSPAVMAMSRFTAKEDSSPLTSFSFLAVNDKPSNHKDMIVGVVSNTGLIVNDFYDNPGFKVRETRSSTFSVTLLGSGTGDNKSRPANDPIVIASPQWYTDGKTRYPPDLAHIGLAVVRNTGSDVFDVIAGTSNEGVDQQRTGRNIGMNFIAFDRELENENIVIGFVDVGTVDGTFDVTGQPISNKYEARMEVGQQTSPMYKIDELCEIFRNEDDCPELRIAGSEGGVRVTFSQAFKALPSIILTPVVDVHGVCGVFSFEGDDLQIPHCIVETIEKDSFFVKCACLTSPDLGSAQSLFMAYTLLPFNFVATGPV